jgi:hypothetical protein
MWRGSHFALPLVAAATLIGCKMFGLGSDPPEPPRTCVTDLQSAERSDFDLEPDVELRLGATLQTSVHVTELVKKLDREVADTCLSLARDLDSRPADVADALPAGERAKQACDEAATRIKAAREAGGIVLLVYPASPLCDLSLDTYSSCARQCDMTLSSFATNLQCDPELSSGRCPAQCTGNCFEPATQTCRAACRGTCKGSCDSEFFGKCDGRCVGTCDGVNFSGKCKGSCEGKCLSRRTALARASVRVPVRARASGSWCAASAAESAAAPAVNP